MKTLQTIITLLFLGLVSNAIAGDDPSIKGELRKDIQSAMDQHIKSNKLNGNYVIYDAVNGEMKNLTLVELHSGIVKKGEYYVSCADFVDNKGKKYDLDFLVSGTDSGYKVLQSIVHSVEGKKRKYHVEG